MDINLNIYAVRNNEGKFFRAKGYGGGGNTWVDDINKAKIYGKIGAARRTITWFANNYPEYPVLELIKLNVTSAELVDETKRVKKAKDVKEKAEIQREKEQAERNLKNAERDLELAKDKLNKLKNKS